MASLLGWSLTELISTVLLLRLKPWQSFSAGRKGSGCRGGRRSGAGASWGRSVANRGGDFAAGLGDGGSRLPSASSLPWPWTGVGQSGVLLRCSGEGGAERKALSRLQHVGLPAPEVWGSIAHAATLWGPRTCFSLRAAQSSAGASSLQAGELLVQRARGLPHAGRSRGARLVGQAGLHLEPKSQQVPAWAQARGGGCHRTLAAGASSALVGGGLGPRRKRSVSFNHQTLLNPVKVINELIKQLQ